MVRGYAMRILVFLSVFVLGLFAAQATNVTKDSVDEATAKTEQVKAKAEKAEKVKAEKAEKAEKLKESKKAKAEKLKEEADTEKVKKESKKKVAKEAKDQEEKAEKKMMKKGVGEPEMKPIPSHVAPKASALGAPINVNTASAQELEALNGIGPVKAQAIVEYRKQHGAFKNTDDLINVPGIGDKTAETLKDQIKFR